MDNFGIKKYIKNKDLRSFFIEIIIFFGILFGVKYFIFFFFRHTSFFINYLSIPSEFTVPFLRALVGYRVTNSFIFVSIIFLIFIRKEITQLKCVKTTLKNILIYGSLAILFLVLQYVFKYYIRTHLDFAFQHLILFITIKFLINLLFVLFLAFAVFTPQFIFYFIQRFYKQILLFSSIFIIYYFIIDWFGRIWFILSKIVTLVLSFIFRLSSFEVTVNYNSPGGPILGVNDFVAGISKDCSGVDSLLLFLSLYIFLVVLNWKDIDKKRMAILFIPGLIGTWFYNILRIYLLVLAGVYISPEFAVDAFHSNLGWILFLLFFFVFWHFGSKYVYKK